MSETRPIDVAERIVHGVEVVIAYVLVVLFIVGTFDLGLELFTLARTGQITEPRTLITVLDVALLLFIIVEVFRTVVAYAKGSGEREIVQTVIYAGIIAVVRKIIVFQTEAYGSLENTLLVALSYGILLVGLAVILVTHQRIWRG